MLLSSALRKAESLSIHDIRNWLGELRAHSQAHFSHFRVAAILKISVRGESYYVAGVNVENAEFGLGTCAEEGAIAVAATAFGPFFEVSEIYVMGMHASQQQATHPCYPCGECRQRLVQYATPDALTHLVVGGEVAVHAFAELFPFAFSFAHIAPSLPALCVTPYEKPLTVCRETSALDEERRRAWLGELMGDMRISGISEAALLELDNGYTVAGVNVENPAYTSSSSAFAAAVSAAATLFGSFHVHRAFCHWRDCRKEQTPPATREVTGTVQDVLRLYAAADMPVIVL